jgi:quercetin dioxygenase-like cupin family protein
MILRVTREGACLRRHQARGTVLIQVLSGHIRARVLCETIDLTKGHVLSLDPHLIHDVEAMAHSAILIMIAWPHNLGIVSQSPADTDLTRRLVPFCSIGEEFGIATAAERNAA